jgi:alpha-L-fucosidase
MKKKLRLFTLSLLISSAISAQNVINYTFDNSNESWTVSKGKTEIIEQGAYKGKALRLSPNTSVGTKLSLQPFSTYKLTVWMRTESGADDLTMKIDKLGKNNVSVTTALATWTKFERTLNVSDKQNTAELQFVFGNSQGNTNGWIDEVSIERIGDYKEIIYTGIPEAPTREIKTDLGIEMQPDEKMQWMLNDKIGMFIHWGLYAGPAKGEWYMENYGVKPEEYRKLAYPESGDLYFDAKDFDAKKWVELAQKMGARYMNMVTQHHDGYALYESHYMNAFTSKQTHNRDFVKEYVDACREAGLKVGIYKTLINWRYPGYYDVNGTDCKTNKFGYTTAAWHKENARIMKEELYCQIKELATKYGKLDQLYWDGGWLGQDGSDADGAYFWESGKYQDNKTSQWPVNPLFQDIEENTGKSLGLMGILRKYQPDILTNPRSGWIGDYTCEEGGGSVTGEVRSGVVEKNMALSPGWGYTPMAEDPEKVMSLVRLKRIFGDCMVRNMPILINIGPDRHGNVPKLYEQRLTEFGDWVKATSEAVYNTKGGPWQPVDGQYGFCYKDNIIYIYFLGGYSEDTFTLPPVNKGMKVIKAYNVYNKQKISTSQKGQDISIKGINPVQNDLTVIAVVLNKNVR